MLRRLLPVLAVCALAACGSAAPAPVTTTTVPGPATTTTVPYRPGAGLRAWNTWIKSVRYIDVSRIAKSGCGSFTMLATENGLTFYMWDGLQWKDVSYLLAGGHGQHPTRIWTMDFTLDGDLDFFVQWDDAKLQGGARYGAYFAYPWTQEGRCKWQWMDVDNGRDLGRTIESPEVDERNVVVRGKGYDNSRWASTGRFEFQSSSSSFVWVKDYAEKSG